MDNQELLEKQHSEQMNQEAIDRIKKDAEAQVEADRIEAIFFEDDAEVKLRDGKVYRIPPCSLKQARKLMKLIKTVNVDAIILNFVPSGDESIDSQRETDLFDILMMGFKNYPHVDKDYIDEYVDLEIARKIVDTLIGLNGLKK